MNTDRKDREDRWNTVADRLEERSLEVGKAIITIDTIE